MGFIGLNPGNHWAATAHIPALKALPNHFVVVGLANTSLASAQNAADAFGLPHSFENAQALAVAKRVYIYASGGICDGMYDRFGRRAARDISVESSCHSMMIDSPGRVAEILIETVQT